MMREFVAMSDLPQAVAENKGKLCLNRSNSQDVGKSYIWGHTKLGTCNYWICWPVISSVPNWVLPQFLTPWSIDTRLVSFNNQYRVLACMSSIEEFNILLTYFDTMVTCHKSLVQTTALIQDDTMTCCICWALPDHPTMYESSQDSCSKFCCKNIDYSKSNQL